MIPMSASLPMSASVRVPFIAGVMLFLLVCGGEASFVQAASFDINGPTVELRRIQHCTQCGTAVNVTTFVENQRFVCPGCEAVNTVLPKRMLRMTVHQVCPKCQSLLDVHECAPGEDVACPVCHAIQPVQAEATILLQEESSPVTYEPPVVRQGMSAEGTTLFSPQDARPVPPVDERNITARATPAVSNIRHTAANETPDETASARYDSANLDDLIPGDGSQSSGDMRASAEKIASETSGVSEASSQHTATETLTQEQQEEAIYRQGMQEVDDTGRSPARNRRNFGMVRSGRSVRMDAFPKEPPARTRREQRESDDMPYANMSTENASVETLPEETMSEETAGRDIIAKTPASRNDNPSQFSSNRDVDEGELRDDPRVHVTSEALASMGPLPVGAPGMMAEVIDENGPVIPRGAIRRPASTIVRPRRTTSTEETPTREYGDSMIAPSAPVAHSEKIFRVAAMVNGEPIRSNEVEVRLSYALEQERLRMGHDGQGENGFHILLKKAGILRSQILDTLINDRLILQQAKKDGIQPKQNEIAAEAERVRIAERRSSLDNDILTRAHDRCVMRMVAERLTPAREPLPREMKQYYASHRRAFMEPARVTLRAVVIYTARSGRKDRRDAGEVMVDAVTRLHQTGDFSAVVRAFSEDSFVSNGGIQMVNTDMHLPVERFGSSVRSRLAKAKTGDVIGPFALSNAHVLLFVERLSGGLPRPLEDVQEEVVKAIQARERDLAFVSYVSRLRKAADIRIL